MATGSGEARGGEYQYGGGEQVSAERLANAELLSGGLELAVESGSDAASRVAEGRGDQTPGVSFGEIRPEGMEMADKILDAAAPAEREVTAPKKTREERNDDMKIHLLEKSIQLRLAGDIAGADKADAMLKTLKDISQ